MSDEENLAYDEDKEELLLEEKEEPVLYEETEQSLTTEEAMLQELKLIREQLTPKKEVKEEIKKKRFFRKFGEEFVLFIRKYKILGLAVAFIMATYVGLLVQALVDDIIMPIFQYIPGFFLRKLD